MSRRVWHVVLMGVVVSTAWASHAADEAPATGLRGVLPSGVPGGLTASVESLPENWKTWGEGLSADLATLYDQEGLDVIGQRKAIGALDARLKTVSSSLADPAYRSMAGPLVSLHGGLKRRLELIKGTIDTLELGPGIKGAATENARREVVRATDALARDLTTIRGGDAWVKYLQIADVKSQIGDDAKAAATLTEVHGKLEAQASKTDAKIKEFVDRPAIVAFKQAIQGYLTAAAAPARENDPGALRKSLGELLSALEEYEVSHSTAAVATVRKAFAAVRSTAPDGGERISLPLRTHYFNYNMRVIASEEFLNKLVSDRRQESGGVSDYVLGASVSGNQTTVTQIRVNLVPSANAAQFDIVADGSISSSTVGQTSQANIYTQGNHRFIATKRVLFNGDRFSTQPANISVNANNYTTGASTNMGLFSGIADGIAVNKANEMRGQSEAIAASRIREQVLPKLNTEVDKEFGASSKVNSDVAERLAALRELQLYPDAKSWSTTDNELRALTRLMSETELGGSEPNPALVLGKGVTILVHESLMNNATDRLDFQGQTLTDDQLQARVEQNLTKLMGREVKFKNDKPVDAEESSKSLIFAHSDSIRYQVADGALNVTFRAGLKQEGKEEIPTQIITLPLRFSVDQKNVVIEPGSVSVSAAERANAAQQGVRAGVIKKKFEAAFPRREIDRVATIERDKKKVNVAVTRIRAYDGWLSITME